MSSILPTSRDDRVQAMFPHLLHRSQATDTAATSTSAEDRYAGLSLIPHHRSHAFIKSLFSKN
jgi:hypothetical protein